MSRHSEKSNGTPIANRGLRMAIKYPKRSTARSNERRVVYLRYATPPVTAAEVEIMHQHLERVANDPGESAVKGNAAQSIDKE